MALQGEYLQMSVYIDDTDLNSKATFNLLGYLYSLQAAGGAAAGPMLTVGVGN